MAAVDIVAIVNPFSGAGATRGVAEARVALLTSRLAAASRNGTVHVTERPLHAAEIARAAVDAGARMVIAWGGDGTINEVGTALAGTGVVLGIIPAGSGNGFASDLGIPFVPEAAIDIHPGTARREGSHADHQGSHVDEVGSMRSLTAGCQ